MLNRSISRRCFLRSSLGAAALAAGGCAHQAWRPSSASDETFSFLHISDTHVYAARDLAERPDPVSWELHSNLIEQLNTLAGREMPETVGGGRVLSPRGVILTGDITDSGDKTMPESPLAQRVEAAAFAEWYGLTGCEGKLRYPIYEMAGNHDGPAGEGPMIEAIRRRNGGRVGLAAVSANGMHYSWDWGGVHCLSLGVAVAPGNGVSSRRRYNPLESLEFLRQDLAQRVGNSGRPVILCQHLDPQRHVGKLNEDRKDPEWDAREMMQYYQAIKPYNVAGVFYGHTHRREILHWKGDKLVEDGGIPLFNLATSGHFRAARHSLFYVEVSREALAVRECVSTDRWQSLQWTPQLWRSRLS